MRIMTIILSAALVLPTLAGCSSHKRQITEADMGQQSSAEIEVPQYRVLPCSSPGLLIGGGTQALPKAVIYKTNGNYDDNVAVTLNADRTAIVSYPAPSDVSADSAPLHVADGYLLDRQGGIGPNTAFLRYTYREYASLKHAPTPEQLMSEVIGDARVTTTRVLDISAWQALEQPALVDSIIARIIAPTITLQ